MAREFQGISSADTNVSFISNLLTDYNRVFDRPRAAELLPNALACASRTFKDILPTIQRDVQLNIVVDRYGISKSNLN
jgi:hypothetical protein